MRIERLVSNFDLDVEWIHFPLHPETPPGGKSLEALFAGRNFDLTGMLARLRQVAESQGLPWGGRTHTYNSRLAQELALWADTEHPASSPHSGSSIHDALFRAYFVDGLNLHDIEVLVEVATTVGLPAEQARSVITERRFREAVDAHWQDSREAGVTGVPTFVIDGLAVVGAQPYEMLERLVKTAIENSRNSTTANPS